MGPGTIQKNRECEPKTPTFTGENVEQVQAIPCDSTIGQSVVIHFEKFSMITRTS